jgi:hypothetical protein
MYSIKHDYTDRLLGMVQGTKLVIMIFTFAPCMLLHLLYLKPTHALILKHTFTSIFIKTLKLV